MKKVVILLSFIFGLFLTNPSFAQSCNTGDGNGDGKVDGLDYIIWLNNY